MSYPVLNSSVQWDIDSYKKTPVFNSSVQPNVARRGVAAVSMMPFPAWDFNVSLPPTSSSSLLSTSSIVSQFLGTFGAAQGQGGLWWWNDATDYQVTTAVSGMLDAVSTSANYMTTTVNGTSTQFQLVRTLGGLSWDVIQNLNGSPNIYVNGDLLSSGDYTISNGVVTFAYGSPAGGPPEGATLTWSGNFYFLCRFGADSFEGLSMIGSQNGVPVWTCDSIKFGSEFI